MKKKRNYYNLIVYILRVVIIMDAIFLILLVLGKKKYEILFLILFFSFCFLMYILLAFLDKYENKITIDLDFPRKLFVYSVLDLHALENSISIQLTKLNYVRDSSSFSDFDIYYNYKYVWWYSGKKRQLNTFVQFEYEEFTKEIKKYLLLQRQEIFYKLHKKAKFCQTIFLVKIKKNNKYLEKYLKEVVPQFLRNYFLIAILVEEEGKIYIPHCDISFLEYREMRKRLEKILYEHIKRVKK